MRAWAFSAMLVVLAVLASAGAAQRPPPLIVVASDRVQNSAGQIYLLDPYTGRKQNLSRGRRTWGDGAVFGARRSMALAFTRAELICCSTGRVFRDVWIREGSGRQLNLTATPELDEKAPSVSPDGRTVAYYRHLPTPSGRDDVRLVVHSRGGPAREVARLPFTIFEPPAWSPDGETLLVGENDPAPEATIWLAPLNRPARKVDLPTAFDAAWLPSGRVVVAGSRVREGRLDLFLLDAGGTVLRQLTRTIRDERYPRPSPDGRRLAFLRQTSACLDCEPRFRIWVGDAAARRSTVLPGRADRLEWSPDGRFLALAIGKLDLLEPANYRLAIADLRTRRVRRLPLEPQSVVTSGPGWLRGRVVYTSEAYAASDEWVGRSGLWLVRENGVAVRRLSGSGEVEPSWSPDGRRLVYVRRGSLWSMGASGRDRRRLTSGGDDSEPAWSPSGRTIVFVRNGSLHLLDRRSRTTRRLIRGRGHSQPSWSPDGNAIAFATRSWERPDRAAVWTVSAKGTGLRRVASGHGPSWSPDGRRLAFERVVHRGGKNDWWVEVWTAEATGGSAVKLADVQQAEDDGRTAWSPDGGTILFQAAEEIYAVPAGGGPVRAVTNNPALDADPAWRP